MRLRLPWAMWNLVSKTNTPLTPQYFYKVKSEWQIKGLGKFLQCLHSEKPWLPPEWHHKAGVFAKCSLWRSRHLPRCSFNSPPFFYWGQWSWSGKFKKKNNVTICFFKSCLVCFCWFLFFGLFVCLFLKWDSVVFLRDR